MDVICYSAAISACEKCSTWQTAFSVLDDMRRRGPAQSRSRSENSKLGVIPPWSPVPPVLTDNLRRDLDLTDGSSAHGITEPLVVHFEWPEDVSI